METKNRELKTENLRFYGQPFTEAEASWPPDVRARMKKRSKAVVMKRLGLWRMPKFLWHFARAHRRTKQIDLTEFRERGLDNQTFLDTQIEYLAFFIALQEMVGTDEAISIAKQVMDEASYEPLSLCLPEADKVRQIGDPMDVMREYLRAFPDASESGGSHQMTIVEDEDDAFQFDVSWCAWLELAKAAEVPEACIPNCYADDLVFPDYFGDLGIDYKRSQTLACGGTCCDFRFEKKSGEQNT